MRKHKRMIGGVGIALLLGSVWVGSLWPDTVHAADPAPARSKGQMIYVPVYSSVRHFNDDMIDLSVKISIRNTDPKNQITLKNADYFDNNGVRVRNFIETPVTLPAFGTHEVFIKQAELRGDTGANFVISWGAETPTAPPLIESIMVGTKGVSHFAFTSRGVAIPP